MRGGLVGDGDRDHFAGALDAFDRGAFAKLDAVGEQAGTDDGHQLRIVLGEDRRRLDHRHLGPEVAEGLGQLDADRPAADHQQMARQRSGDRIPTRW